MIAWIWFVIVQLVQIVATVAGWVVLIPFCLAQAWHPKVMEVPGFPDRWTWGPLNYIYGNPEDGVSGMDAKIWNSTGQRVPYMPSAWAPWRAYCWSALRNSCDNLKYVFAWKAGPLVKKDYTIFGKQRTFRAGWQLENGFNVPVLSV